jgi:hypothetical protein
MVRGTEVGDTHNDNNFYNGLERLQISHCHRAGILSHHTHFTCFIAPLDCSQFLRPAPIFLPFNKLPWFPRDPIKSLMPFQYTRTVQNLQKRKPTVVLPCFCSLVVSMERSSYLQRG